MLVRLVNTRFRDQADPRIGAKTKYWDFYPRRVIVVFLLSYNYACKQILLYMALLLFCGKDVCGADCYIYTLINGWSMLIDIN